MLISTNRPAIQNSSFIRPKTEESSVTLLAPGDTFIPSEPNAVSVGASGAVLGLLAGGGLAALADNLGFGSAALMVGLVVAGGIGGGFATIKAWEALQK